MSFYDYQKSLRLEESDPSFYSLIMAAFRKADTDNLQLLREAFPETYQEFVDRYYAPYGRLPGEKR